MRPGAQHRLPLAAGASLALHAGATAWLMLATAPGDPSPVAATAFEVEFAPAATASREGDWAEQAPQAAELPPPDAAIPTVAEPLVRPVEPPPAETTPPDPPAPAQAASDLPPPAEAAEPSPLATAPAERQPAPVPHAQAPRPQQPAPRPPSTRPPQASRAKAEATARPSPGSDAPARQRGGEGPASAAASETPHAMPVAFAPPPVVTTARYRHPPTPPAYPPRAISLGLEGTALVRALVGTDGATRALRLHRSSGHHELDQAALAAVRGWAFAAATEGGRPIEAWVEVPVRFRLD